MARTKRPAFRAGPVTDSKGRAARTKATATPSAVKGPARTIPRAAPTKALTSKATADRAKPRVARPKVQRPKGTEPTRYSARLQDRINGVLAPAPVADINRISKATRQPKRLPRYDCMTCDRNLASSTFPKYAPTDKCAHYINTCRGCLKEWIGVSMDNTTYDKLSCPECPEILQNEDVLLHADKKVYGRFDRLQRRGIAETVPGWRWCMAPKCRAGQVHEPSLKPKPVDKPKPQPAESESSENKKNAPKKKRGRKSKSKKAMAETTFTCTTCGHQHCVNCSKPHPDETCREFKDRLERQQGGEEEATLAAIERDCKQCPHCSKNIEKNGGCDAVSCTMCGTLFCWLCLANYTVINQTGHEANCAYARPGRVDPHAAPMAPQGMDNVDMQAMDGHGGQQVQNLPNGDRGGDGGFQLGPLALAQLQNEWNIQENMRRRLGLN